jgi:hypothetical protein
MVIVRGVPKVIAIAIVIWIEIAEDGAVSKTAVVAGVVIVMAQIVTVMVVVPGAVMAGMIEAGDVIPTVIAVAFHVIGIWIGIAMEVCN